MSKKKPVFSLISKSALRRTQPDGFWQEFTDTVETSKRNGKSSSHLKCNDVRSASIAPSRLETMKGFEPSQKTTTVHVMSVVANLDSNSLATQYEKSRSGMSGLPRSPNMKSTMSIDNTISTIPPLDTEEEGNGLQRLSFTDSVRSEIPSTETSVTVSTEKIGPEIVLGTNSPTMTLGSSPSFAAIDFEKQALFADAPVQALFPMRTVIGEYEAKMMTHDAGGSLAHFIARAAKAPTDPPIVRIADFYEAEQMLPGFQPGAPTLGASAGFRGTLVYMASELLHHLLPVSPGQASDVCSLGVVIGGVLTCAKPFDKAQFSNIHPLPDQNIVGAFVNGNVRPDLKPLPTEIASLPVGVTKLITRCWHGDRKCRFTASQCHETLEQCLPPVSMEDMRKALAEAHRERDESHKERDEVKRERDILKVVSCFGC